MRDVAVVSFAQAPALRREFDRNEVEILMPVVHDAVERSGIPRQEIGFTCSGSCDYLQGQPFAFVMALDAVGAWPPIIESHVEMDAAWALYEAWVKMQTGEVDSALVYGFSRSSLGDLPEVLTLQLDPYTVAPLWPDTVSLAALQARALLDAGRASERDLAPGLPSSQARLPAHLGRGGRHRSGCRRRSPPGVQAARMDHGHRPSHRAPGPRPPRPDALVLDPTRRGEGRCRQGPRGRGGAAPAIRS
jgi:hypothetical protein